MKKDKEIKKEERTCSNNCSVVCGECQITKIMKNNNYKWDLSKKEQNKKDNEYLLQNLKIVLLGILTLIIIWEFLYYLSVFIKCIK